MLEGFDTTRCAVCGKAFTARTGNTFWIGNAQQEILGVAHLKCQRRRGEGLVRVCITSAPPEYVHFCAWYFTHQPYSLGGALRYAATLCRDFPLTDTPNAFQTRMLAYWSRPDSKVGAAMAEAAWERYLELAAEYGAYLEEQSQGRPSSTAPADDGEV